MKHEFNKKNVVRFIVLVVICAFGFSSVTHCMKQEENKQQKQSRPLWRTGIALLATGGAIAGMSYGTYLLGKKSCPVIGSYGLGLWNRREELLQLASAWALKTKAFAINHPVGIACGVGSAISVPLMAPYAMVGIQGIFAGFAGESYLKEKRMVLGKRITYARGLLKNLQKKYYNSIVEIARTKNINMPTSTEKEVEKQCSFVGNHGHRLMRFRKKPESFCLYRWLRPISEIWWDFESTGKGALFVDRCSGIKASIRSLLAEKLMIQKRVAGKSNSKNKVIKVSGAKNQVNQNNVTTCASKPQKLSDIAEKDIEASIVSFTGEYEKIARPLLSMIKRDCWVDSWCATLQKFGL